MHAARTRRFDGIASQGRRRRGAGRSDLLADISGLRAGDAAATLRLQRSIGNAGVARLLARDRKPKPGDRDTLPKETQPPPIRRDPGEDPYTHVGGLKLGDGGEFLELGPLPGIPLNAKSVRVIRNKLRRGEDVPTVYEPLRNPRQGPFPGPPGELDELCAKDPSRCKLTVPPEPGPILPDPEREGALWSSDVLFDRDRPRAGTTGSGMTAAGVDSLASIIAWLEVDPTLAVRLVGHTSSEGSEADNRALSTRRVQAIKAAMAALGHGDRIADPVGKAGPAGCTQIEFGMWACGESGAAQDAARPADRRVVVTLLRNARALARP